MPGTPLFMRDVLLTLKLESGGTRASFQCDLSTAEVVTTPGDDVSYPVLCGTAYSSVGASTYSLHVVAVQRWSVDGLANFLWTNEGALAEFQYQAHGGSTVPSADAPGMQGQVRLVAPTYGGTVDEYAELDVELPCSSRPAMMVAAFPTAAAAEAEPEAAEAVAA